MTYREAVEVVRRLVFAARAVGYGRPGQSFEQRMNRAETTKKQFSEERSAAKVVLKQCLGTPPKQIEVDYVTGERDDLP